MDIVNKSKALNILIPRLIDRSNSLTREIKSRMKLNKIFSEFENKASNNLNYFITASNHRYTSSKLGNDLDSIISSTRAKNINEATKIINDNFYKDSNLEIERQKMKYKSTNKINKDIKDIFNKMKLPLETKFSNNNNREIQMIIKGMDNQLRKERIYDNNDDLNEKKEKISSIENVKRGKNTINDELEKEQISIENTINKYLNNINNVKVNNIIKSSSNSPSPHKKQVFKLPKIKLINYKKYKPPKRKITTEEDKKPDIKKLLPYSSLGKNCNIIKKNEDSSLNENDLKNLPFITEPNFIANKKNDYHNTLNVVYNSANNEFKLQNSFDEKRRKLEDILGINNIPKLDTYDDIAIKKSEKIKNDRHKKAKKISESQKFAVLSRKAKVNMIIENDMDLLDKLENKIYNNANNYLTK
jgi:hypothetical protein